MTSRCLHNCFEPPGSISLSHAQTDCSKSFRIAKRQWVFRSASDIEKIRRRPPRAVVYVHGRMAKCTSDGYATDRNLAQQLKSIAGKICVE